MGVAAEVFDNVLGSLEGTLGIHMPVLFGDSAQQLVEGFGVRKFIEAMKLTFSLGDAECCAHLAAQHPTHSQYGKQKLLVRRYPGPIGTQSPSSDDGMHVRVKAQLLVPSVQYHRRTESGPQSALCKCTKSCARAGKKQTKHHYRSESAKRAQLGRQRKDDVKVRDIEQSLTLLLNPALLRERLALRTMPIAARVIGGVLVPARLTDIEMAAQDCRAALRNVCQHPPLLSAEANRALESRAMLADDVGEFEVWRPSRGRHG